MTREELLKEARRKALLEAAREKAALDASGDEEPEDMDSYGLNLLRTAGQGLTFGFGDEIAAGIGSAFSDESYDDLVAREREQLAKFAEDNPMTAFAAELGGGLITGGAGLTRTLGATGLKSLAKATTTKGAAGRGAVEGAAYGIGSEEGDLGDRLKNGAVEGAIGGVMGGAFNSIGKAISKRRVDQDLVDPETGEFTPIQLATDQDSRLGQFYRDILGRGSFGSRKLRDQQRPLIQRAMNTLEGIKDEESALRQNATDFVDAKKEIVEGRKVEIFNIEDRAREAAEQAKRDIEIKRLDAKAAGEGELEALEIGLSDTADNISTQFRQLAGLESLPPHARSLLDDVDLNDPLAVKDVLQDFYQNKAFRDVKDTAFKFDGELPSMLKATLEKDPDLAMQFQDALMPYLQKMQRRLQGDAPTPGKELVPEDYIEAMLSGEFQIQGDALLAMRNLFANNRNGAKAWGDRQIKDVFDSFITRNLDDAAAQRYRAEMRNWPAYQAYVGALRKTNTQGDYLFNPKQYAEASAGTEIGRSHYSLTPLEDAYKSAIKQLDDVAAKGAASKKVIQKANQKADRDIAREGADRLRKISNDARLGKRELRLKNAADLAEARKNKQAVARQIHQSGMRGGVRREAEDALREIKKRMVGDSTLPSQLNLDRYAGELVPIGTSRAAAAWLGGTMTSPLSTQGMQRLMAGQTGLQEFMADALRSGRAQATQRALTRPFYIDDEE